MWEFWNLNGPEFLALYVVIVCLAFLIQELVGRLAWAPANLPPLAIPEEPDPMMIAFLRGGANGVITTTALGLTRRGLLTFDAENKQLRLLDKTLIHEPGLRLNPVESQILTWMREPGNAACSGTRLIAGVKPRLAAYLTALEAQCTQEGLLFDARRLRRIRIVCSVLIGCIALLGLIKLAVALTRGKSSVMGIIVIVAIATFFLYSRARTGFRLTARGASFLRKVRSAFAKFKQQPFGKQAKFAPAEKFSFPCQFCGAKLKATASMAQHVLRCPQCGDDVQVPRPPDPTVAPDPVFLLSIAVFGTGILAATHLSDLASSFVFRSSAGGWLSGGSDGGGDGGCGGGCGGCGG